MALLHALDGRVRIRVPDVKGRCGKAREVEACLLLLDGVQQVSVNPTTGSALVLHDRDAVSIDDIMNHLRDSGFLKASPAPGEQGGVPLAKNLAIAAAQLVTETALKRLILTVLL